jgi:putative transposase
LRFAFIQEEKATYPVTTLCRTLAVSRCGFYAWQSRPESKRHSEDRRLTVLIRASHEESRRTYGSPRVHIDLADLGERVGGKRVARLMQQAGLKARVRRRYKCTTMSEHDQPIAPNLLARRFEAEHPNQRWVTDTTELLAGGGRVYLAAVLDLYSRVIVGWALSAVNDRHLTLNALDQALRRRHPEAGLLHHSDQGSTYASENYRNTLTAHGITCSMSRRGNCHDNAAMESWFSTLKFELGERFDSAAEAKHQLFEYIEVFYNQKRRHSSVGNVAPAEAERRYAVGAQPAA